jgi:cobalt-zinc-cadmium efflux system membrane fusion protein
MFLFTNDLTTTTNSFRGRVAVAASLVVGLILLGGCDGSDAKSAAPAKPTAAAAKGDDGHGHAEGDAHAEPAAKPAGGEDPHDHGGGEHADEVKLTAEAVRSAGIRLATVKPQSLTATIGAPARVAYNAEGVAHVGSLVNGRVVELPVRVGDTVKKGDVLAVIDSHELGAAQSEYLQRRTATETARPAIELAKSAFDRAQQLYDQTQGISLTEVQSRQKEYRTAVGELAAAEAALRAAANRLQLLGMDEAAVTSLGQTDKLDSTYRVRAPIAGRVIEREATLGELVGPDKERLLMLADMNTVWVLADVPEAELPLIAEGAAVQISVAAGGGETFEGKVAYLSPELDAATRTARVRVEVSNADMKLRPGMFARTEIAAGAAGGEPVLAVPDAAIQTVEGEPAVFVPVAGEPNTYAKRAVGIGPTIGGMVPVFAGLKDGEQYVSVGSFILKAELGKAGAAHEH